MLLAFLSIMTSLTILNLKYKQIFFFTFSKRFHIENQTNQDKYTTYTIKDKKFNSFKKGRINYLPKIIL